jgi:hypothetical protein
LGFALGFDLGGPAAAAGNGELPAPANDALAGVPKDGGGLPTP